MEVPRPPVYYSPKHSVVSCCEGSGIHGWGAAPRRIRSAPPQRRSPAEQQKGARPSPAPCAGLEFLFPSLWLRRGSGLRRQAPGGVAPLRAVNAWAADAAEEPAARRDGTLYICKKHLAGVMARLILLSRKRIMNLRLVKGVNKAEDFMYRATGGCQWGKLERQRESKANQDSKEFS
ncbi:hypothetical protein NDU88_003485 [Pleurodeles waltl]|uniref:Uncharacterized protein n=1 Tax=Pleurodeles waltl TaxID=8319 RepID=A0AAV7KV32_PLEWA|nr:hypothetical protein NDU88_003485 [Pleurodeles waltl]